MAINRLLITALLVAFAAAPAAAEEHEMKKLLRVAGIQMEITTAIDINLARILRGIDDAHEAKARIVLLPETALSGFDQETVENLDWNKLAEAEREIAKAARRHDMYVLYGTATPSGSPRPYNSGVLLGPDGEEITRYHKMVPEPWFEPGDHLAYFHVDGIPCTMIICHDNRYPELVRIPVIKGAQICFYISYEANSLTSAMEKMEGYRAQLIARAAENGIWVAQANGTGIPAGREGGVVLGYSRIVDPHGVVVTQAPALKEALIVADIDPARAKRRNALNSPNIKPLQDWWRAGLATMADEHAPAAAVPEKTTARLALMQAVPEKWNLEKNFATFEQYAEAAAKEGTEIFITPECWLDGYASPDKDSTPDKLRAIAQDLNNSEYLKKVAQLARTYKMHICFGFTSLEDGNIYNAAGLWNAKGERVGVYHKTHLQNHDLQYSPGDSLPVYDSPWGPLGIMICADRRWPETARTLRVKGAKLILNPTYGMCHEENEWWMRTRGYENQCYIAFAHPEVGFVVDPKGRLSGKRAAEPGVLYCDVDLAKAKDDNHIRDRRPELYEALSDITLR